VGRLVDGWDDLIPELLRPLLRLPRHPFRLAAFGADALLPARRLAESRFAGEAARALFAGLAGHAVLPLERWGTSAPALLLAAAGHAVGWPSPAGGAQRLADALASYLVSLGGEIETGSPVRDLAALPPARAVLCDLAPRPFLALAGDRLPARYRRALERFRYASGIFKLDLLLDGPVPWAAAACRRAGTVHVGGTLAEIAAGEAAAARGERPRRPFVLVAQTSLFDPSRAPAGRQVLWAYCHAPAGGDADLGEEVEAQIERFAPGFRDLVVARHRTTAAGLEAYNPNYVGGDVGAGAQDLRQVLARPVARPTPYRTPVEGLYLCSASTPPGGGVHGMCGFHAARAALADRFGIGASPDRSWAK
jgi:phytoene dehydrogenase-like protein